MQFKTFNSIKRGKIILAQLIIKGDYLV